MLLVREIIAWCRQPVPVAFIVVVLVLFAGLGLRQVGALEPLELIAYDEFVRLRAQGGGTEHRIVQIAIDERDLKRVGWPLSDGLLATIIEKIRSAKPRAIGVDILRPVPVGSGTDALDRVIAKTPQLVWVDRFSEAGWQGIPAPAAASAAGRVGFADLVLDHGLNSRRALLYLNDSKHWEEAFSLQLAELYLAPEGIKPTTGAHQSLKLGHVDLPPIDSAFGGYVNVDARGYQILREFRAPVHIRKANLRAFWMTRFPSTG